MSEAVSRLVPRLRPMQDELDWHALKGVESDFSATDGIDLRIVEWTRGTEKAWENGLFWLQAQEFVARSSAAGIEWLCWIQANLGNRGLMHAVGAFEFNDARYFLPQVDRRIPRRQDSCLGFILDANGAEAMRSVVLGDGFGFLDLQYDTRAITLVGMTDSEAPLDLLLDTPAVALSQLRARTDCVFIRLKHMSSDAVVRAHIDLLSHVNRCFAPI